MLIFLFFFALWLLFNGRCTWDVVGFGLVFSAVVTVFAVKICGWSAERSHKVVKIGGKLLRYAACLFVEIIKANLATLRVILAPGSSLVRPQIFRFDSRLHKSYLQTILANSITITPGTYTIGIDGSVLTVHGLNTEFAEGTPDSGLNRQLMAMERSLNGAAAAEEGKA
ncbi:MAG: Na+/H+ antiporter subunit E [Oscillospiraceae bacterium]|nr:Na+/H+ antiporter subunit E [Oscillospiraceae bacterium]